MAPAVPMTPPPSAIPMTEPPTVRLPMEPSASPLTSRLASKKSPAMAIFEMPPVRMLERLEAPVEMPIRPMDWTARDFAAPSAVVESPALMRPEIAIDFHGAEVDGGTSVDVGGVDAADVNEAIPPAAVRLAVMVSWCPRSRHSC